MTSENNATVNCGPSSIFAALQRSLVVRLFPRVSTSVRDLIQMDGGLLNLINLDNPPW